jgi:hypothetical protein
MEGERKGGNEVLELTKDTIHWYCGPHDKSKLCWMVPVHRWDQWYLGIDPECEAYVGRLRGSRLMRGGPRLKLDDHSRIITNMNLFSGNSNRNSSSDIP